MHILESDQLDTLEPWIQDELTLPAAISRGMKGSEVRRVQELVVLA